MRVRYTRRSLNDLDAIYRYLMSSRFQVRGL
ncbi:MAG: hypothetical protein QOI12_606 [Alphaproteobacteria bacterium]|jgi:plasmid stabilization system protein ParE|nr:hypothetical protein [Alphaproteobacteria bacterium]